MKMQNLIKVILAIAFVCCLFDMPYGYYQLVRFVAMIGFGALAYYSSQKNNSWMILWIVSAVLINPIFKIALGRQLWNVVDVIWAILLLVSLFDKKEQKEE